MGLNFSDYQKNQTKVSLRVMKPMRKGYSCPAIWNGEGAWEAGKLGGSSQTTSVHSPASQL